MAISSRLTAVALARPRLFAEVFLQNRQVSKVYTVIAVKIRIPVVFGVSGTSPKGRFKSSQISEVHITIIV